MSGAEPFSIRTVEITQSTNADMLTLAADGLEEGVWLRAERQSAGRGRQGRSWEGEAGNLFASGIVRIRKSDPPAPTLALVAAVAVFDAVRRCAPQIPLLIKWPNDLLVDGGKLAGILLERAGDAVVVGIGVNVAQAPVVPGRKTASLQDMGFGGTDAAALLVEIARRFATVLAIWRERGLGPIRDLWTERAHPAGTPLRCALPDGSVVDGAFERLDASGALIVRLANGAFDVIHAGDVILV